jgi:hypothetical protein
LAQDTAPYFDFREDDALHNVIHLTFEHHRPMTHENLADLLEQLCQAWGTRPSRIFNRHACMSEALDSSAWGHQPADTHEDLLDYYQFDWASAARSHTSGGEARLFLCWNCAGRKAWQHFAQDPWVDDFNKTLASLVYSGVFPCCRACVLGVCMHPYHSQQPGGTAELPPPPPA